jgi:polysaccharide export outer membrane protein
MNVQSVALVVSLLASAQGTQPAAAPQAAGTSTAAIRSTGTGLPTDYVIGTDDVLSVVFWKDPSLSGDVTVRPDGKITLALGKELVAAGLTPDQLRAAVVTEISPFFRESPTVNVIVKQINSRKVFITGMVERPGFYAVTAPTTVMQLLAMSGGLREYAKGKEIVVVRNDGARTVAYPFNYEEIAKGRNLTQNIVLRPGDTVVVP